MIYCHKCDDPIQPCDWKHEQFLCPKHGFEKNLNGTLKSTLSPEKKIAIRKLRETKNLTAE